MRAIRTLGLVATVLVLSAGVVDAKRLEVCTSPDPASAYQLTLEFGSVGQCLQFAANYTFLASPGMWVNVYEQCDPMAVYCMDFPDLGEQTGFTLQSIPQEATNVAWGGLGNTSNPTLGLAACSGNGRLFCGNGCTGRDSNLVVGTCGSVQGNVCRIDFRFSMSTDSTTDATPRIGSLPRLGRR